MQITSDYYVYCLFKYIIIVIIISLLLYKYRCIYIYCINKTKLDMNIYMPKWEMS